jgi:hypothetical protein
MPFNNNITPGAPPILWSDVNDAFTLINENFDILVATVGSGSGLTPVDFTSLDTSVSPTTDNLRDLGDATHKWGAVFSSEHTTVKPLNGLWAGSAQVKGVGLTINLPENSTIGGDPITGIGTSLIIDPDKTFFKIIEVDAGNSIVANTFGDTLNLISGSGVNMLVSSGADSITISNTGVLSVTASSGISVSTVSGTATVTNTGVRSLQSTTALPAGRTTGAGINITAGTGDNIRITNTGVISITSGGGITVSTDVDTGIVQLTNSAPAVNAFTQIEVNGDVANRLLADAVSDVLNITSGEGITLTKNPATDTITITVNPVFDLRGSVFADDSTVLVDAVSGIVPAEVVSGTFTGTVIGNVTGDTTGYHTGDVTGSVFADDSTMLVDGVDGKIVGDIETASLRTSETKIALGENAGLNSQGIEAIAIGPGAGNNTQGNNAVAIGEQAGNNAQGIEAVAIGRGAGNNAQGNRAVAISIGAGSTGQGVDAIAIGYNAGQTSQGIAAVAIGALAGETSQSNNSIIINATGAALDQTTANTFTVKPIRNAIGDYFLQYDPGTGEITYNNTLTTISADIIGSVFADDSTILVNASDGSFNYIPATPGDWDGTAPTTVGEAIDRLATLVKALNSGTGA